MCVEIKIHAGRIKRRKKQQANKLEITLNYNQLGPKGEHLMSIDLKDKQSYDFVIKTLNKNGKDAPVDGPIVMTITGETSVDVFFDEPARSGKVSYLDGGPYSITFTADADLSSGVRNIVGSISGVNAPLEAESLVVEPGPVQSFS